MIARLSPVLFRMWQARVRNAIPLLLLLFDPVAPVAAQDCFGGGFNDDTEFACRFRAPRWSGEVASLGANAFLGAVTAGLIRELHGGSFSDGFVKGALGGVITYAGKRVAAERFDGAGFLGRQIAAIGSSATRNAGADVAVFDRMTLPLGPIWLDVYRGEGRRVAARVDPAALGWIVYGIAESELEFDAGGSLSSGGALFRTKGKLLSFGDDSVHAAGVTNAGVVYIAGVEAFGPERERRTDAHERIHVLQQDQLAILWTMPLGEWALRKASVPVPLASHVTANFSTEIMRLLAPLFDTHEDRPWELEAIFHAR